MPTNLPPEARAKWAKYLDARTPEEKLRALEEYLSTIPKHKGTENLRAWVRRKIAELREEIEERKARRAGKGGPSFFIEKEGAAQVVILGLPNSGKSALLRALTNAKPSVSDVPFTTKFPVPGMLRFEDVQFQLVEAPSMVEGISRGAIWWGSRVLGLARNADALLIVLDITSDPLKQLEIIMNELREAGIHLLKPKGEVQVIRSKAIHGVRVISFGRLTGCTVDDVRKLLEKYGIHNAEVRIVGEVTLDDIEEAIYERKTFKPSVVVLNKVDLAPNAASKYTSSIKDVLPYTPVVPASALTGEGLQKLPKHLFKATKVIRIYTKEPTSNKPSRKPLILREGATVEDAVRKIREDFLKFFKYARIWGPSAKYPGERVGLDHRLMDGDVLEIRTTVKGI
ncbi:MAG: GTP-binding protein [Desulfurococcales archaeon]|nr:GTP-binding protein [Desulfurococcales archaeon]